MGGLYFIIELLKQAGALEVVRRVVRCGSMRRLQERLLGHRWYTAANASAGSEIWVLGLCYKVSADASNEALSAQAFEEFLQDFSSRIWITYRKGLFHFWRLTESPACAISLRFNSLDYSR